MMPQHRQATKTNASHLSSNTETNYISEPWKAAQNTESLAKLYDVFEREAKRIAHRLHDESSQVLAVVYLELAEISRNADAETTDRIKEVIKLLDNVSSQLRSLSHELRPIILDQIGLMPALRALISGIQKRCTLHIDLSGETGGRLNPDIETVIYRTTQEALTNIQRHASATHVHIRVWCNENYLYCSISDNGCGLIANKKRKEQQTGLGLIGIRERARSLGGTCEISSEENQGTTLTVTVPL